MLYKKVLLIGLLLTVALFKAQQENTQSLSGGFSKSYIIDGIDNQLVDIKNFYDSYNRFGKNSAKAFEVLVQTMSEARITPSEQKRIVKSIKRRIVKNNLDNGKFNLNDKQVFFGSVSFYDVLEKKLSVEKMNLLYHLISEKRNKANNAIRVINDNFYQLRQKNIIDVSYHNSNDFIISILK